MGERARARVSGKPQTASPTAKPWARPRGFSPPPSAVAGGHRPLVCGKDEGKQPPREPGACHARTRASLVGGVHPPPPQLDWGVGGSAAEGRGFPWGSPSLPANVVTLMRLTSGLGALPLQLSWLLLPGHGEAGTGHAPLPAPPGAG